MNSMKPQITKIDIAAVKADAVSKMRENNNYKRTALMLALVYALTNVPVLLMNFLSTALVDPAAIAKDMAVMINTRIMIFQLLVTVLITPAFALGSARFMLKTVSDGAGSPMELFNGLDHGSYFVSVRAMLWTMLMTYVWAMIPMSMLVQGIMLYQYGSVGMLIIGIAVLLIVLVSRGLAYALQFYFLARQPKMGAVMSLRFSVMAMRGRLMELLKLELSMILYFLPGLLVDAAIFFLFKDNMLFGAAMALLKILLSAVCRPVPEAAKAIYFMRLNELAEKQIAEMKRRHQSAWSDDSNDGGEHRDS